MADYRIGALLDWTGTEGTVGQHCSFDCSGLAVCLAKGTVAERLWKGLAVAGTAHKRIILVSYSGMATMLRYGSHVVGARN